MASTTIPLTQGTWTLDAAHSGVYFKVRHRGLTNVRGRFNGIDAWLKVGEDLDSTSFGATIDITSVDTNQSDRDNHLRSTDFFSADQHPTMTFESTLIKDEGYGEYQAEGTLTLYHGTTEEPTRNPRGRVRRYPGQPGRWQGARRLRRHGTDPPRRVRHRLQHAARHGQVRPRQEDRHRDRRRVPHPRGLILTNPGIAERSQDSSEPSATAASAEQFRQQQPGDPAPVLFGGPAQLDREQVVQLGTGERAVALAGLGD